MTCADLGFRVREGKIAPLYLAYIIGWGNGGSKGTKTNLQVQKKMEVSSFGDGHSDF